MQQQYFAQLSTLPILIEIRRQTDGWAMRGMLLEHPITTQRLVLEWSEPLTSIEIYLVSPSQTSPQTLQTRYDSAPRQEISASLTSSSKAESLRLRRLGAGVLMMGLIAMTITSISALLQRATKILGHSSSRY